MHRAPTRLQWATWTVVTLSAISTSIYLLDRPLAELAASHPFHFRGAQFLVGLPGFLLALGLIAPIIAWIPRASGLGCSGILVACGNAVVWTAAAVELVIKRVLGRSGPHSWLEHHEFAFHWFGGNTAELRSMPSGEMAILASTLGVLWIAIPRWRGVYLIIGAGEALGLVWFNWHFASDILMGAAIGAISAALAVNSSYRRPAP